MNKKTLYLEIDDLEEKLFFVKEEEKKHIEKKLNELRTKLEGILKTEREKLQDC